jgi:hypothetical protein
MCAMIEKLRMWSMRSRVGSGELARSVKRRRRFQRKLTSRRDVKARSAVLKLKKRHVE